MSDEETTALLLKFSGGDLMQQYDQDGDHVFTAEEKAQIEAARTSAFATFQPKEDRGWLDSWAPKSEGGNGGTSSGNGCVRSLLCPHRRFDTGLACRPGLCARLPAQPERPSIWSLRRLLDRLHRVATGGPRAGFLRR